MSKIARIVMYVHRREGQGSIKDEVVDLIHRHDSNLDIDSIVSEEKEFDWSNDLPIGELECGQEVAAKFFRELKNEG